jgi:hypothetical protein
MKTATIAIVLALGLSGCRSSQLTPGGAKVEVYETHHRSSEGLAKLPQGCRYLASSGPIDQQAPERLVYDPYRKQRNWTAEQGGNVLLLRSSVLMPLPKTECPPNDRSYDCQETLQTWYRVEFEAFACDPPALETLAAVGRENLPDDKVAWWWPFGKKKAAPASAPAPAAVSAPASAPAASTAPAPATLATAGLTTAELKSRILDLMHESVSTDVIVAYVKSRRVATALTADEIIDWKKSGIAEPVIEAAIAQGSH